MSILGMGLCDINNLSIDEFHEFSECANVLEARELLMKLRAADWPNMHKNERAKLWKELHKKAYPESYKNNKRVLTTKELASILSGMKV
jgi:hypothetical protein